MNSKKIALIGGAGFIGHNLALSLKKRGHKPVIIDSLAVNNILSFTDSDIKNRKLYWSMLNQRMDLLHDNDIEININENEIETVKVYCEELQLPLNLSLHDNFQPVTINKINGKNEFIMILKEFSSSS